MKIVVVGYNHYGFVEAVASAFDSLDQVHAVSHCHDYIPTWKAEKRHFLRRFSYRRKVRKLNLDVLEFLRVHKPDLIVVIEGCCLLPEVVSELKRMSPVFLWCFDSLRRLRISKVQLDAFSQVFIFEETDKRILRNAQYLPIGYDNRNFFHADTKKIYDLVWVGSAHTDRLCRLDAIAKFCLSNDFRFAAFGQFYKKREKDSFKSAFPSLFNCIIQNSRITPQESNIIYNSALFSLNLHSSNPEDTAYNARHWEVPATGSILLTDWKDGMKGTIEDAETAYVYKDIENLCQRLPKLLGDENKLKQVSKHGMNVAQSMHSFVSRSRQILEFYKKTKSGDNNV